MEIRSFTTVYLDHLTIAHLYALTQSSIAYATPAADNLSALLRSVLMQLADDSNVLGDQMKKASKNVFTTRLAEMDLDASPYELLCFTDMPKHSVPLPPTFSWYDLDDSV